MVLDSTLGHLSATVDLDIQPFLDNQRALESQVKKLTRVMNIQKNEMNQYGSSKTRLLGLERTQTAIYDGLNKTLSKTQAKYERQKQLVQENGDTSVEAQRKLVTLQGAYEKNKAELSAMSQQLATTSAKLKAFNTPLGMLGNGLDQFGTKAKSVATKLSDFGKTATLGFSVPIALGMKKAISSAVEFQSSIGAIGPLLRGNGEDAAQVTKSLAAMSSQSLQWSAAYGVSVNDINDAMGEMIRRGFSSTQTLGSFSHIMDATRASGEAMGDVMEVTASVIEMFGMKSETAAGQAAKTKEAVDVLTYVANASATDFKTMGDALTYVGPTAAALKLNIEDVSAAIGLMSNQGVDASKAGTALNSAFSRILSGGKAVQSKIKALGIDVDKFKSGQHDLADVIDEVNEATKHMNAGERTSAIIQAFGKQAQGFTTLLNGAKGNAKEAGNELREMAQNARNAAGETAKMAKEMNNTPAAKMAKMKESFNALAINIGQRVLPALTPLMDKLSQMAIKFSELDPNVQSTIAKLGVFSAVIAPLSFLISKPIAALGSLASALGKTFSSKAIDRMLKTGKSVEVLSGATGTATTEMELYGGAASTAGGSVSTLGSIVSKINPWIAAGTVALAAGTIAYQLWGKKAVESAERTQKWGVDVGQSTDTALTKISNFQGKASASLNTWDTNTKVSAKGIAASFKGMTKAAEDYQKSLEKEQKSNLKDLSPAVQGMLGEKYAKTNTDNKQVINGFKQAQEAITSITKKAATERRALTTNEQQFILSSSQANSQRLLEMTSLNAKDRKKVALTLSQDLSKMSTQQLNEQGLAMKKASDQLTSQQMNESAKLNKLFRQGSINASELKSALETVSEANQSAMEPILAKAYELQQALGNIGKDGTMNQTAKDFFANLGVQAEVAKEAFDKVKKAKKELDETMFATGTTKADQMWNFDFLFDAEKGIVRTKEQLKDFLSTAIQTQSGWNNIKLVAKDAKLTVSGAKTLSKTIVEAGKWNKLELKGQKALIDAQYSKGTYDLLQYWVDKKELSPKTLEFVAKGDPTPIARMIEKVQIWRSLSTEDKEIIVKDKATVPILNALSEGRQWQNLTLTQKNAIINAQGTKELQTALINANAWNDIPLEVKKIYANDADFMAKLQAAEAAGNNFGSYALFKKIQADSTDFDNKVVQLTEKNLGSSTIQVDANTAPVDSKFNTIMTNPLMTGAGQANSFMIKGTANTDDAESKLTSTNDKKTKLDKSAEKETNFSASFPGAADISKSMKSVAGNWQTILNKTSDKTFTTTFKTINVVETSKKKKRKTGDRNWQGGNVIVGDGGRQEVVFDKATGSLFTTPKEDTQMNLSKGSIIWRSLAKFEHEMRSNGFNAPRFARGTTQNAVRLSKEIPKAQQNMDSNTNVAQGIQKLIEQNVQLMSILLSQNPADLIAAMLGKIELSTDVTLNKREMASFVSEVANKDIAKAIARARGARA